MPFRKIGFFLSGALVALACAQAQPGGKKNDPDLKEVRDFRLNMDVVQHYVKAFQLISADPGAKKCMENGSATNAPTLDAGEKLLNACPALVADIKTAGMKPREFMIVTAALIGDMMAVGLKKQGALKQYPDSISQENAAFIEQNFDKLQSMMAPMSGGRR